MVCDARHFCAFLSRTEKTQRKKNSLSFFTCSAVMFVVVVFNVFRFVFAPAFQMPELSDPAVPSPSPEMASILENLQKQKLSTSRQNVINSSSSTSSVKETSSSQQVCDGSMVVTASLDARICLQARPSMYQ